MRTQTAPKKEGLSSFECIYVRPYLHTDTVIGPEALELTNYVSQVSPLQQTLGEITQPLGQTNCCWSQESRF